MLLTAKEQIFLRKAAERGAAFLDKKKSGWYKKIYITKLDMHSPSSCILGQLYSYAFGMESGYGRGVAALIYSFEGYFMDLPLNLRLKILNRSDRLGFSINGEEYSDSKFRVAYSLLNDHWKEEIRNRRRNDTLSR